MTQLRRAQLNDTISKVDIVAPTVNDDETLGYAIGSAWFDTVTGFLYYCEDPTATAAVWTVVPTTPGNVTTVKVPLTSAQILALNSVPQQLVAAPGGGFALRILAVTASLTYNSAAYATNTQLNAYFDVASNAYFNAVTLLDTSSTVRNFNATANTFLMPENTPFMLTVQTGDPTAGDSDIDFFVTYTVITL